MSIKQLKSTFSKLYCCKINVNPLTVHLYVEITWIDDIAFFTSK